MMVMMKPGATDGQVRAVEEAATQGNFRNSVAESLTQKRVIIFDHGAKVKPDPERFRVMAGVERVSEVEMMA